MKDFNYYAPTEVVFGEQSEEQVAALVKKYGGTKVLVHYGGQSAVHSGLEAMERFYHAIGMPVNIKELIGRDITDEEIKEMTRKCSRDYTATCGALKVLKAEDMEAIYRMAR